METVMDNLVLAHNVYTQKGFVAAEQTHDLAAKHAQYVKDKNAK